MLLFRFLEKEKLHEISIETYVKLKQKKSKAFFNHYCTYRFTTLIRS